MHAGSGNTASDEASSENGGRHEAPLQLPQMDNAPHSLRGRTPRVPLLPLSQMLLAHNAPRILSLPGTHAALPMTFMCMHLALLGVMNVAI